MDHSKLNYFVDDKFKFIDEDHTYWYGDEQLMSVTRFIGRFSPKFDSGYWAEKKAKEKGVPVTEILEDWDNKAKHACDLGTEVHEWIEYFLNKEKPKPISTEEVKERIEKFARIYKSRLHKLQPVKQEFQVFSRKWKLAGTIDALFHLDGKVIVGDWKTNKKFTTDKDYSYNQKLLYPFEDLDNNNLNKYSIQLSLYRLILQEEAGYKTHGAFLCHIGPKGEAEVYQAKDLRARLKVYLNNNRLSAKDFV